MMSHFYKAYGAKETYKAYGAKETCWLFANHLLPIDDIYSLPGGIEPLP